MIDNCLGCEQPYCDTCADKTFHECGYGLCQDCAHKAAEQCVECGDDATVLRERAS